MEHFQDKIFTWIRRYREIFKSALVMKNPSTKKFSLREIYNNNKTQNENTACVPARARAIARVLGNSVSLLFMDSVQLLQAYKASTREQVTFNH